MNCSRPNQIRTSTGVPAATHGVSAGTGGGGSAAPRLRRWLPAARTASTRTATASFGTVMTFPSGHYGTASRVTGLKKCKRFTVTARAAV
jgi:hypothetical protein